MPQMASLLMEVYFCTGRPKTNNDLLQSYYDSFDSLRIIKGKGSSGQANCDSTEEWFALQQTLVEGIRCTRASSDIYFFASDDVMMSQTFILILIVFREVYGIKESKYQWSGKGSSQQQLNDFMAMEYSASNFIETLVACDLVEWRSKYCRIVKREYNPDDFTKIRKNTRKVMLKEYQEDNRNEQLTNIKAISKTAQETSFERADFTIDDEIKEGESSFTKGKKLVHGIGRKKNKTYRSTDAFHNNKTCTASKEIMILLVFLVFGGMIVEVDSGPLATTTSTKGQNIFSYDLLITQQCSLTNFNRAQSCQLSQTQLEDTIRHCGFQALCKPGYKARCVNTLQDGMAHICSHEHLSCARGMWMKAWINEKNHSIVKVQEEKCRKGTFQPSASNCYDACTHKHLNIKSIPDKYVVHSEGNHFSPIVVYCNYKKGYYNLSNKTFLNYDQEIHNPYFCWHVKQVDPHCEENKYPLPNGTCVFKCMPGECRDDHDDFICKRNCRASDEDQDNEIVQQNKDVDECLEKINVCKNGECQNTPGSYSCKCYAGFILDENELDCIAQMTENNRTKTQDRPTDLKQTTVTVLCITIPVVCGLIGFIVIVIIRKHRRCSNESAVDNTSPASSEGDPNESVVESPSHLTSDANHSVESDIPNGKSDTSIGRKTKRKASIESRKGVRCGDADKSEECITLLTNDDRNDKSEARRQNEKVCWTEAGEVNDRENDRPLYATKPLLNRREPDHDFEKTRSQTQQKLTAEGSEDVTKVDIEVSEVPNTDMTESAGKTNVGEELAKGRNELLSQGTVNDFSEYMKSVGALIYKDDIMGTVFRVGDDCVMTAFHVIRNIIDVYQNGQRDFTLLERDTVSINFNASVVEPARKVYRVCHQFSSEDPSLDFAVLKITNPEQLPKKMFLDRYNFDRLQVTKLSGIGYGHPDQGSKCKKNLDPNCSVISSIDNRIATCLQWLQSNNNRNYYLSALYETIVSPAEAATLVDTSYTGIDTEHNIFLDITMVHGGSGSPFLTNDGRVVGILTHGHPEFCFKLPLITRAGFPKKNRFESILKMSCIYEHIVARDPTLASNLFGES